MPLTSYRVFLPTGHRERELRERGVVLIDICSSCKCEYKNVEMEIGNARPQVSVRSVYEPYNEPWTRTYRTPAGSLSQTIVKEGAYGTSDWTREHLIKKPSDYTVLRYLLEAASYMENYSAVDKVMNDLGEDGIVYCMVDRSPLQQLIVEWAGIERFAVDYFDNRDAVDELLQVCEKKQEEVYRIAAASPAEVIWAPDNLMGDVVGPEIYRRYLQPFYRRMAEIVHKHGKLYAVHMDGKLASIADLIKDTPVDIVDSFSLPDAGGDLPAGKALEIWPDKSVLANVPATLGLMDDKGIKAYCGGLKTETSSFSNFGLQVSEDIPTERLWETMDVISRSLMG
jgi:hypothetical protein